MISSHTDNGTAFHYSWIIVFSCFFISGGGVGILINTLGTFIKPVSEAMGYTRAQFSLVSSLTTFAGMFTYPLWGRYIGKHSIKKCMIITGILISVLLVCFSFCNRLWQFYLCALLIGTMTGSISSLPVTTLINNWFKDSRGLATGLGSCGSGLAMVIIPAVSNIITRSGWRVAYIFIGILFFLIIDITAIFLLHDKPADKGLEPYRANNRKQKLRIDVYHGITLAEAKKTISYRVMLLIAFFAGAVNNSITSHIYAFASDLGYTAGLASIMASIQMLCMMLSKLSLGFVFDKLGLKVGVLISVFGYFIAATCFSIAGFFPAFVVIGVICAGVGAALPAMSMAYSMRQLFGDKEYSAICGLMLSFTFLGNTVGTTVTGLIYDILGSYSVAWAALGFISLLMAGLFLVVFSKRKKESVLEVGREIQS